MTTLLGQSGFVLKLSQDDRLSFRTDESDKWLKELDAAACYCFSMFYSSQSSILGVGPYGYHKMAFHRDGWCGHVSFVAKKPTKVAVSHPHVAGCICKSQLGSIVKHPHIVRVVDVFEIEAEYAVVTERQGGFRIRGSYHESDIRQLFRQVLLGVTVLHDHGLVHGSLKPSNIMLTGDCLPYKAKIAPAIFGLSGQSSVPGSTALAVRSMVTPTPAVFANGMDRPHFLAPEQVTTNKYGSTVDSWACGMMIYAMFTGGLPFPSADVLRLYTSGDFTIKYDQPVWRYVSAEALALTKMLLCKDPGRRISAFAALHHRWFVRAEAEDFGDNYFTLVRNRDGMRAMARRGRNPPTRRNIVRFRKCVYAIAFLHSLSNATAGKFLLKSSLDESSDCSVKLPQPPVSEGEQEVNGEQQHQEEVNVGQQQQQEEEEEEPQIRRRPRSARFGAFLRKIFRCFKPRN